MVLENRNHVKQRIIDLALVNDLTKGTKALNTILTEHYFVDSDSIFNQRSNVILRVLEFYPQVQFFLSLALTFRAL